MFQAPADGVQFLVSRFGKDVYFPAQQLGRQLDVLALTANGVGQLIVGHNDFQQVFVLIHHDAGNSGRGQRVARVRGNVLAPDHNIDALAVQFLNDILNARAANAHAGAHRVHIAVAGEHGHLGPAARVAGNAHNLDNAVVHFGHFALEQGGHIIAVAARDNDLRPAPFLAHVNEQGFHPVAALEVLTGNLLFFGQKGLGAAEVDDPAGLVAALDDAGHDFAHAVLVFFVNNFLLGVAHSLDDDLLGRLGGNAPQILNFQAKAHFVVKLHGRIVLPGLFQGNFLGGTFHFFGHDLEVINFDFAGFLVVGHFNVHFLTVFAVHGSPHGIFQGIDQHVAVQALVLADLIQCFFKFHAH